MAWFILKQPNELLTRWSDVLDGFGELHMTRQEAISKCMDHGCTVPESREMVDQIVERPFNANKWNECIRKIWRIHGKSEARRIDKEGKKPKKEARKNDEYVIA